MQKRNSVLTIIWLAFLLMLALPVCSTNADIITHLKFKQLSTIDGLPTDEVQKVYQDRDGFVWIATRYGLCLYDGYQTSLYKSNLYTPDLLSNNNIYCLTDDNNHNIWIGTQEGLNVLNKETGVIKKDHYSQIGNNSVSCLLTTGDNTVWVGTDAGLFKYDATADSMLLCSAKITGNVLFNVPIKSLFEDSEGDVWIGTWSSGLYRYSPRSKRFYAYPKMNKRSSAHVVYEDSHKNIWVGAWDEGLFLLKNPKDMKHVSWINFRHQPSNATSLSDNIVYDISEDLNTHSFLYKKLKSLTGLNTSAFIRNIRLKAACQIMEEKRSIRVSELAYAVGFNDPKYFSSCFKKEFNMLPTEYIERFLPENHLP